MFKIARFDHIMGAEDDMMSYDAKKGLGDRMNIHILNADGGIIKACQSIGASEENIRKINKIEQGEPAVGEEILGLLPTRSYQVAYGDTPERIAMRFGIKKRDLLLSNPWLATRDLRVGENIALRYDERRHGMKVANGYFHDGCDEDKLRIAMPFLTYVTFSSAVADRHGIRRIMKDKNQVRLVTEAGKIPLIKVHDCYSDRFVAAGDIDGFAESLTAFATDGGYRGIVLNSTAFSHSAKEYMAFIMKMRKLMIGCDLILITEIDENSPVEFSEYADGSVVYYPKFAMDNPPSFEDGERRVLADFACRGESAKAFVDLSCLARCPGGFCPIEEALEYARARRLTITKNENTLLSHFSDKKQGGYTFGSLSGLRAIFDLIFEFDYMGICFDIMRVPISYLMMYNAMFKTCYQSGVRSQEEYSHEGAE